MGISLDPPGLTPAAAATLYAPQRMMRPTGPLLAVTGDSLQSLYNDNSTSGVANGGPIISRNLAIRSGGRIILHQVVSVPGAPISGGASGWVDVQIPAVVANPVRPNACLIAIGRNSVNPFNFATFTAAITSGCNALIQAGIVPILLTCMPTGVAGSPTAPESANMQRLNRWFASFAAARGIPIFDQYAVLADPSGGIKASFKNSADSTHLNRDGYEAVTASLIAQGLPALFPAAPPLLPRDAADGTNLCTNGVILSATTGYATYGTTGEYSVALVDPDGSESVALPAGVKKYQLTINAGASGDKMVTKSLGAVTAGNVIEVVGYIKWAGFKANSTSIFQIAVSFNTTPSATIVLPMNSWATADGDGLFYWRGVVPAGASTPTLQIIGKNAFASAATIQVACVACRDLTALGAAS